MTDSQSLKRLFPSDGTRYRTNTVSQRRFNNERI